MDPEEAMSTKAKLSFLYAFLAWNAFGAVAYFTFTGRKDWPEYYGLKSDEELAKPAAVYYAELLGIKRADIYSLKGFTKVKQYEYVAPEELDK